MRANLATKLDLKRKIAHRSVGHGQDGITRLVSPSGTGEMIKPFVFLDRIDVEPIKDADVKQFMTD